MNLTSTLLATLLLALGIYVGVTITQHLISIDCMTLGGTVIDGDLYKCMRIPH